MISTDEDYTGEECVLSDHSKIPFTGLIPSGSPEHLLVSLGEKLAVYFLISHGTMVARLKQNLCSTPLVCGQGRGPVAAITGPCCRLCCGKDSQRVLGSDLVSRPDTAIRNQLFLLHAQNHSTQVSVTTV